MIEVKKKDQKEFRVKVEEKVEVDPIVRTG